MMNKNSKISLFWKFSIAITASVAVFGLINLYFVNYAVYDLFEKELIRHGKTTATSIAERSIMPIAYGDLASLNQMVTDEKKIDSSIAYIFILGKDKKIVAHTFQQMVPIELLNANKTENKDSTSLIRIQSLGKPNSIILDIAIPIMHGNLGVVRIGLKEESYMKSKLKTTRVFLVMIGIFIILGILGALFFSYIITFPLKTISNIAKKIELGTLDIQQEDFENIINKSELIKWKNLLSVTDEIDDLIDSFNEMVSRLKQTYTELKNTQSSLFQSEKMASLGTLSAGIAHEINNPIAGIQSCVRRLQSNPENIKQNILYLEMIDEAIKKMETVVKELLNYSRKQKMQFSEVILNSLIDNVLLLSSHRLEKERIAIVKDYDKIVKIPKASGNHLEQVILNLLLNSIDAIEEKKHNTPNFQGEIRFKLSENNDFIKFEISDNGIGLPEENLKDIFTPFFTKKKIRSSTGLGMAVSYSIIEQHKGNIFAHINKNKGLTITIKFPKKQDNDE